MTTAKRGTRKKRAGGIAGRGLAMEGEDMVVASGMKAGAAIMSLCCSEELHPN